MSRLSLHESQLDEKSLLKADNHQLRLSLFKAQKLDQKDLETLKAKLDSSLNSDTTQASKLANICYELAKYLKTDLALALGHWAKALGLSLKGDFESALIHFENARVLYAEQDLKLMAFTVFIREMQALAMLGQTEKALDLAKQAVAAFRAEGMLVEAAKVQNNVGIILYRLGHFSDAIKTLKEVASLYEQLANVAGIVQAEINLANAYQDLDDFITARQYFQKALSKLEASENKALLAGTRTSLALLERREGRLAVALDELSKAKFLYATLDESVDYAHVELEEARVKLELNLLEDAELLARKLITLFAERGMQSEMLDAKTVLGLCLSKQGLSDELSLVFSDLKAGWLALGNQVQAAWVAIYLANYYLEYTELSPEAHKDLEDAMQVLEASNSKIGKASCLLLLAQSKHITGQQAADLLRQAADLAQDLAVPDLLIRANSLLGKAAQTRGALGQAEAYFKEAIKALEGVRSSLTIDAFKTSYFGEKLSIYNDLISLLLEQKRFKDAFDFVERSKARALLDSLTADATVATQLNPRAEALSADLIALRERLNKLYVLAEEEGPAGESWRGVRDLEKEITALRQELDRLLHVQQTKAALVPSLKTLQESLSSSQVIVEFFALNDELMAFVISHKGLCCVRKLGLVSELSAHLERLQFAMLRVAQGQAYEAMIGADVLLRRVNANLAALHKQIIEPLELKESVKQLILIPYGPLHALPFSALYSGEAYLGEQYLLALAPSAAVYLHCLSKDLSSSKALVAFGIPFEDIPSVEQEITAVSELFADSESFLAEEASLNAFVSHARSARVLHIATHGVFRPDNPMFSGLKFADGWLAARDLQSQQLSASLVVLSACETGLNVQQAGDEVFGLARGFFFAGATTLVTSLWAVKDEQTSELMIAFYEALNQGSSVAEAMQKAQASVRSNHPNPYFWSAFSVMGDPNQKL